jgi:Uma2 family endonuclease
MSTALLENDPTTEEGVGPYTAEDLLRMPDGDRYELIDGRLVERHMGARASAVAARVTRIVGNHVESRQLGFVFGADCGYQIFPDRPKVRYPDGSYVARSRLPGDKIPGGYLLIPPDLATEVVSPNDTAEEVEAKRLAFLQAGTRMLWVIFPENRTVHVYRQVAGRSTILDETGELKGEDVLPDFVCRVAQLFEGV